MSGTYRQLYLSLQSELSLTPPTYCKSTHVLRGDPNEMEMPST